MKKKISKLKFKIIECSSEDIENPVSELLKDSNSNGWLSSRFSKYPQEIIFQFQNPVELQQINILSHEKKISSLIEVYSCNLLNDFNNEGSRSLRSFEFEKIGHVRLDQNKKNEFKSRELRRIYFNSRCQYLKIVLDKNYVNKYNIFNQIGLISIEFLGLNYEKNDIKLNSEENLFTNQLDNLCQEKIKILQSQLKELEDQDEIRLINEKIETCMGIGKKIYDYETTKKNAIKMENFDVAKMCKFEIDNLKSQLRNIDKPVLKIIHNEEKNSIILDNPFNKSLFDNSLVGSVEDTRFMDNLNNNHDDKVASANYNKKTKIEDDSIYNIVLGDLEELELSNRQNFEVLIPIIGEEALKKIFSKNIIYKEQGIEVLSSNFQKIFKKENEKELNVIVNLMMKLIFLLLCDKHPEANIKSFELFEKLLEQIKEINKNQNLNYNPKITNNILTKIKEKVGDINTKLRKIAITFYTNLLSQDFCDYNNLIQELVEEDNKLDPKKFFKSNFNIIGKLQILKFALNGFQQSVEASRTKKETFPYSDCLDYSINNVSHTKNEIRKLSRLVIIDLYRIFGFDQMKIKIEKVEERELEKLGEKIIEIKELLALREKLKKEAKINALRSARSKSKSKDKIKALSTSLNQSQIEYSCPLCLERNSRFKMEEYLIEHFKGSCLMYCHCPICSKFFEIKNLNMHFTKQCTRKDDFKLCKRCKEPVLIKDYLRHCKENKCNPAKNPMSAQRCGLCHEDIEPNEKGWFNHLVEVGCEKNKRKNNKLNRSLN